ncbi:CBF-domain-containing protein [Coemansia reversa NRRL 1564]|uniref:CBF-domain-containing protein n=1 Tax=Coemansia reversa (strain ATCC 12441 / NRRL 1564) TaxID=763665 RepID=A0A2G5BGQ9_COERN|nr:CBF-domain-containing protein [Coemansia reversa NRRL 1564]|eukprot:PIA17897.1 CBF-domain-containing protein [Coemansia reversa NRRL 1564]
MVKKNNMKAQGSAKTDEGKALWEEIQRLGGDKDDLAMLKDVDTGVAAKTNKSEKSDHATLGGDISAFAKSLGLATSASEFVGTIGNKKGQKEAKASPKDSKLKEKIKSKTKAEPTKAKKSKNDKTASENDSNQVSMAAKGNKKRTEKKETSKPIKVKNTQKSDEVVEAEVAEVSLNGEPEFKIKSAKDAPPLSKGARLAVDPNPQWFSIELDELKIDDDAKPMDDEEVVQKLQYAEQLLEQENELYEARGLRQKSLSTADKSFVKSILSSGTLTDRVSALTLIVQESPVHNLRLLEQLMQMVQKNNRREALLAVGSVKDLMSINLLPPTRKLKHFTDQPVGARNVSRAHWIMWAFEDKLKRHYFDLIQVMETMSYDSVLHTRQNMIVHFEELLEQKPEQEQNLLRLLVNKLGDKERQLAAKASYLLLKLLNVHPNMKFVVVKTIQELLLSKSTTKDRAQYYTMITLNQIILSSRDAQTANLLLDVYFSFFKHLLRANDSADALEGSDAEDTTKPLDGAQKTGQKKVYIGQKALRRAKEEVEKQRAEEERSMENKLLVAVLTGLNRALPFAQMEDAVMDKHVGTIFQVAHAGNFNTVVQSLVLLHQIAQIRPAIADRFYRTLYDSLLDPRLDHTSKKAMYLNLLFRALKSDADSARIMAFLRRIMQVCMHCQSEFASGALFLVSQILSLNPQMYAMLTQPEDHDDTSAAAYDPLKRDPRYAHAVTSSMWEATMLAQHFHPSITHSIQQIFEGTQVAPISNLHNHSLAHFLDRFVFRKPKATDAAGDADEQLAASANRALSLRGQSLMQPIISKDGPEMELGPGRSRIAAGNYFIASKRIGGVAGGLDLTSDAIAGMSKSDILPDEQFFHQFFQTKRARMGKKVKKTKKGEDTELADDNTGFAGALQGDEGEMDEDEIWKAMSGTIPKDVAGDDIDVDDDDDDLLAALREDESDINSAGGSDDDELSSGSSGDEDGDDSEDENDSDDDSGDEGFANFDDELGDAQVNVDADKDEQSDTSDVAGSKRKGSKENKPVSKRKKSEKMPLFGSFEDYAHLIDNNDGLE